MSESRPIDATVWHSSAWLAQTPHRCPYWIKYYILGSAAPTRNSNHHLKKTWPCCAKPLANFTAWPGFGLSDKLLTQTIDRWELTKQPADELAGLYRVRATVACCRRADGCRL
jgi:hypothetical protein